MEYVPSTPPPPLSTNGTHSSPQPALPQSALPLLRLPGEIRNRIYEYVFSDQTIHTVMDGPSGTIKLSCKTTYDQSDDSYEKYIALTKTCRQIHQEARLLPFKYCVIHNWCRMDHLALWLNRMDEDMRKIVLAGLTDKQKWCLGERSERKKRIMDL
jgi:hypothetical protein